MKPWSSKAQKALHTLLEMYRTGVYKSKSTNTTCLLCRACYSRDCKTCPWVIKNGKVCKYYPNVLELSRLIRLGYKYCEVENIDVKKVRRNRMRQLRSWIKFYEES